MSKILNFLTGNQESLENQVERLRVLNRQIKQLEMEAIKVKQGIIEVIGDAEEITNHQGHIIATYKTYTKLGFNQKAFGADFPEQYELYSVQTTYRTLLLK